MVTVSSLPFSLQSICIYYASKLRHEMSAPIETLWNEAYTVVIAPIYTINLPSAVALGEGTLGGGRSLLCRVTSYRSRMCVRVCFGPCV